MARRFTSEADDDEGDLQLEGDEPMMRRSSSTKHNPLRKFRTVAKTVVTFAGFAGGKKSATHQVQEANHRPSRVSRVSVKARMSIAESDEDSDDSDDDDDDEDAKGPRGIGDGDDRHVKLVEGDFVFKHLKKRASLVHMRFNKGKLEDVADNADLERLSLRVEPGLMTYRLRCAARGLPMGRRLDAQSLALNLNDRGNPHVETDHVSYGDSEGSGSDELQDDDDHANAPSSPSGQSRGMTHRKAAAVTPARGADKQGDALSAGIQVMQDLQTPQPAVYGRLHVYADDPQAAGWPNELTKGSKARWQPLSLPDVATVRQSLSRRIRNKDTGEMQNINPTSAKVCVISLKAASDGRAGRSGSLAGNFSLFGCYCKVEALGLPGQGFKTCALEEGMGPVWNHEDHLSLDSAQPIVKFELWRQAGGGDKFVGAGVLTADQVQKDRFVGDVNLTNHRSTVGVLGIKVEIQTALARATMAFQALRGLSFLQSLCPDQAIDLLQKVAVWEVDAGEIIYNQGDPVDDMFVIVQGSVTMEAEEPAWGNYRMVLSTVFDGQIFGDRIMAKRGTTAAAQEPAILLCMLQTDYRGAFDQKEEKESTSPYMAATRSRREQGAANGNMRLRVEGLMLSPFFAAAGELRLSHLASNLTEVELRQGDEFIKVGQRVQCCYLVLSGFVKVYATVSQGFGAGQDMSPAERVDGMLGLGEALPPRAPGPRRPPGPKRAGPRRPGQPRVGAPWARTLRGGLQPGWPAAPLSEELEFGFLHPGEAFGIGLLHPSIEDGPYTSETCVRVESCTCLLLVLTHRCLWYLPESVVTKTRAALDKAEDPLRLPAMRVQEAREAWHRWTIQKRDILEKEMLTVAGEFI